MNLALFKARLQNIDLKRGIKETFSSAAIKFKMAATSRGTGLDEGRGRNSSHNHYTNS